MYDLFGKSPSSVKALVAAITSAVANVNISSIKIVEIAALIGRVQVIQATFGTFFNCSKCPQ